MLVILYACLLSVWLLFLLLLFFVCAISGVRRNILWFLCLFIFIYLFFSFRHYRPLFVVVKYYAREVYHASQNFLAYTEIVSCQGKEDTILFHKSIY